MFSRTSVGVAAGAAAIGFIGYCIYFDHKRRSDPMFKQKLRESECLYSHAFKGILLNITQSHGIDIVLYCSASEFRHPSEVRHLHFVAILKSFSCKLSAYMYTLLLKAAIPFIQI